MALSKNSKNVTPPDFHPNSNDLMTKAATEFDRVLIIVVIDTVKLASLHAELVEVLACFSNEM